MDSVNNMKERGAAGLKKISESTKKVSDAVNIKEMADVSIQKVSEGSKLVAGKGVGFVQEFKEFLLQGNVVDFAIGVIIGAAFESIISSLVQDIFSPFIALMLPGGSLDEIFHILRHGDDHNRTYNSLQQATDRGAITLNYGRFFQNIINFILIGLCLFLFLKMWTKLSRQEPSTDFPCPKCQEPVKKEAIRCPHCCAEPISAPAEEAEEVPRKQTVTSFLSANESSENIKF